MIFFFIFIAKKLPKTDPGQQRGSTQSSSRGRVVDIEKDTNNSGGGGCCSKS